MDVEKVKSQLDWNLRFEDEFKGGRGYTFVIDVSFNKAMLSLYRFTPYGSKSEVLEQQPPEEMMNKALQEQGANEKQDGFYYIDKTLRKWLEDNIL
ncbi:MAG: hypothetical protein FH758_01805 [Firmicutes bacterium]|nr:hypothetical protein [Bacillota bacterium]